MNLLLQPATAAHAGEIKSLTSLRFFAAFWVLSLHYMKYMSNGLGELTGFFEYGKLGVEFFFILSGFILTHVYLARLETGRFEAGDFVRRRLARLYPIHFVTFLLALGYWLAGRSFGLRFRVPEAYSLDSILPNLLLIHAWGVTDNMTWNYVSWSISAEWFAYLLFLPLSLLLIRSRLSPVAMVAMAVVVFLLFYILAPVVIGRPLTHLTHDFAIARILPEFLLGVALYHLSRRYDLRSVVAVPLALLALGGVLLVAHMRAGDALAVLLLGFLIFAVASLERQGLGRWLGHSVLVYLGNISYALYMVHGIVFIIFFKVLHLLIGPTSPAMSWALGSVAVLLAFVAAMAGHHWIELPGRQWLSERLRLPRLLVRRAPGAAPRS
jgi:peptidoglycan/LPS O-acetylase OafA/YrhL